MHRTGPLCQTMLAMADFSFSFDSDNPFAEPQATPKPAPATPEDAVPELVAAPVDADADADSVAETPDDDFSLDAFDFAFDEGASINDSLPTRATPDEQIAPRQQTPGEAAFAEFDFGVPNESNESSASEFSPNEFSPNEFPSSESAATELETETEIWQDEAPVESTAKISNTATSDLAEFNALNFDLDSSTGEPFAETGNAATAPDIVAPDATSSAFLLDLDDEIETAPTDITIAPIVEDFVVEEPAVEELAASGTPINETPAVTEIGVPDAVAAAASFDVAEAPDETEMQSASAARPRRLKTSLSVAILGASGIGKNHARWFHRSGCRVVGFLGTSGDSTAQTQADLVADFPFDGTSYTDLGELLATEKPDIVCVATPPALHFGHVLQSLEAGANVLCEKPLVYAPTRKFRENRDGAKELVKVAAKKKLVLGTQLQYGAATPILCKLAGLAPGEVGDFAMELETLNPNSSRDPRELWIDMGPHPISVAQMLAGPGAKIAEETVRFEPFQNDEKTEVLARFGINCADGRLLMVRAVVRVLRDSASQPRRRFSFNGHSVVYAPLQSANGNYQAQFIAPDGYASVYADPVEYLIGDFVRACREETTPLISGDFGRENLEWMLKVAGDK